MSEPARFVPTPLPPRLKGVPVPSRAAALAVLAGDVLVLASRRRTLWLCLIVSTLLVGGVVLSAEVEVDRRAELPAPDEPGGARTLRAGAALVKGSVNLIPATRPGARPAWRLVDDGEGKLRDGPGGAIRGHIDHGAPGEVVLDPDVAPVGTVAAPAGSGGGPIVVQWRERLAGAPDRAALLAEGRGSCLTVGGWEVKADRTNGPAEAAPRLVLILVHGVLVHFLAATLGIAIGLVLVADAVPSAFDRGAADVLLSRPVRRADVVLGRFAGAVAFGALQAGWLVGLAVLLFGLKLGLWLPAALLMVLPLLLKFTLLLAAASFVGVLLRSWPLGLVAAGLMWVGSYATNLTWLAARESTDPRLLPIATWLRRVAPQVPHIDPLAGLLVGNPAAAAEVPGYAPWEVVAQDGAWIVVFLAATCAVVARREP